MWVLEKRAITFPSPSVSKWYVSEQCFGVTQCRWDSSRVPTRIAQLTYHPMETTTDRDEQYCPFCDEEKEVIKTVPWQDNLCVECRQSIPSEESK